MGLVIKKIKLLNQFVGKNIKLKIPKLDHMSLLENSVIENSNKNTIVQSNATIKM